MEALRLDRVSSRDQKGEKPVGIIQSEAARDRHTAGLGALVPVAGWAAVQPDDFCAERLQPGAGEDHIKVRNIGLSRFLLVSACLGWSLLVLVGLSGSQLVSDVLGLFQLALSSSFRWQLTYLRTKQPSSSL